MPDSRPLVSVLMNCYNGACFLREAIDSVIGQTYENWELVFWDNRSTDDSAAICKSYRDSRIRYFLSDRHTNLGGARSLALQQARGDLVAVLDTDDLWLPRKLAMQVPLFARPEVGIVISDTIFFNNAGEEKRLYRRITPRQGRVFHELVTRYFVSLETVVLRKIAIDSLDQSFDASLSHISDFDLIVRLSLNWQLAYVPEVLAKWRVHPNSGTWQESGRFNVEMLQFARKMDLLYPSGDSNWQKARRAFMRGVAVSSAGASLANGDKEECRRQLNGFTLDNWKTVVLYLLSFVPLSDVLIKAYLRARSVSP